MLCSPIMSVTYAALALIVTAVGFIHFMATLSHTSGPISKMVARIFSLGSSAVRGSP